MLDTVKSDLELQAAGDFDAAKRYRTLADKSPSLRRDYLKRAELAEALGKKKLSQATEAE